MHFSVRNFVILDLLVAAAKTIPEEPLADSCHPPLRLFWAARS